MFGWGKKQKEPPLSVLPRHVAVIMDGNGRWAQKRGLPRTAGHSAGAKVFENICRYANKIGLQQMTFYAFSTENWKRPKAEVDVLMKIFGDYLQRAEQFQKENIRVRFVGDPAPLSADLQALMRKAEEGSADFTGLTVNVAINYGGRDEILHAAKRLAEETLESQQSTPLTEQKFEACLYTGMDSDVDLLIRPGGEYRLSNFLLWQLAYAELYFCDTLWPDFKPVDLMHALEWYAKRNRRFGGI